MEINYDNLYLCSTLECVVVKLTDNTLVNFCLKCCQQDTFDLDHHELRFEHKIIKNCKSFSMMIEKCYRCDIDVTVHSPISSCQECFDFCNNVYYSSVKKGKVFLTHNN